MNPLYQQLMGVSQGGAPSFSGGFQNPIQKMQYIMQAIRNPAAIVRQHFPDIPAEIQNNPSAIMQYLQQTRGISNQQIQQAQQMADQIKGQGTVV